MATFLYPQRMNVSMGHAMFLGVILLIAQFANAQPELSGSWVGTIHGEGQPMMLKLSEGLADIPAAGLQQVKVDFLPGDGKRIEFALQAGEKTIHFHGDRKENTIHGTTDFPAADTSFTLRKTINIPSLSSYFGVYQLPEQQVYIRTWDELGPNQLTYLFDSGETGALFAESQADFFSGPGLLVPLPEQITWKFQDRGNELVIQKPGSKPSVAKRSAICRTEEVRFRSGGVQLAGTLFQPAGSPAKSVLILIHGSGAVTRDFYGPIGYYFASHGIAVLAYDKRGLGGSEGNWMEADFTTYAEDAIAAAQFLKSRGEFQKLPLGLWGISQGGWIAPLAASKSDAIDYIVLVSAAVVSPAEQQIMAVSAAMKAQNLPETEIEKAVQQTRGQFDELRSEEVRVALEADVAAIRKSGNTESLKQSGLGNPLFLLFYRKILDYDPLPTLARTRIPTLLVYGDLDQTVPSDLNAAKLEAALQKAGSKCKTIRFPKGDHALMESTNGSALEFLQLHRFVPGYLQGMTDWILSQKTVNSSLQ